MTSQPSYWCVANLGDADPYEHGGAFVLVDRRGIYCPELTIVKAVDDTDSRQVSNIALEYLTVIKCGSRRPGGITAQWDALSDNRFHADMDAWFGSLGDLDKVASSIDMKVHDFMHLLMANNPVELAVGYKALADYHGIQNFDEYPQTLTGEKAVLMCDRFLAQIQESQSWHDGYCP